MAITLSTPLSLYSIPIVWLVVLWPARKRIGLIRRLIGFDNTQPRDNLERLNALKEKYPEQCNAAQRMEGAHKNGQEILPLWIGAVIIGNVAGLSDVTLNLFALAFIGVRMLYNYIYIHQKTKRDASFRSATWAISIGIAITLITKSANRIGNSRG